MFRKKIFSTLILFFLFCVVSTFVSADTIEKQTTTLNLNNQVTENNINTKGWKWNNDTKTLTLKNANFETTEFDKCIILPENCNVTIEFEGNNTLKAQKATVIYGDHKSNLTLKGKNDDGSNYSSFVNYWMPFTKDLSIGMHDASWRDSSEFYKY